MKNINRIIESAVDRMVLGEQMYVPRFDDEAIIARVKELIKPYKRAFKGLRTQKGISFTTYSKMYDPTYNIHWPVLVKVKVGADEEFDATGLLAGAMEDIARDHGRRFSKEFKRDYTELMIR
jgi:hypothetical protein